MAGKWRGSKVDALFKLACRDRDFARDERSVIGCQSKLNPRIQRPNDLNQILSNKALFALAKKGLSSLIELSNLKVWIHQKQSKQKPSDLISSPGPSWVKARQIRWDSHWVYGPRHAALAVRPRNGS
jgi:hypothetical protein